MDCSLNGETNMPLIKQETKSPTNKVTAGALGGATASIFIWILTAFANVEVPPEVAASFATLIGFIFAYFVRDKADV